MIGTPHAATILPTVKTVTAVDEARAINVLVLAFSGDPAVRWMYPDPQQYVRSFPEFVRAFAGQAFACGTAFAADGFSGAALWLPPHVHPDEEALAGVLQRTLSAVAREEVFTLLEQMDRYHPREPHWYLPLIGVDPPQQGRGHGSALLRHALSACDRDGTAAYLESSNPVNIPLYERHGFELLGEIRAESSPPLYPMRRPPRSR